jgi:hypothetical protein
MLELLLHIVDSNFSSAVYNVDIPMAGGYLFYDGFVRFQSATVDRILSH